MALAFWVIAGIAQAQAKPDGLSEARDDGLRTLIEHAVHDAVYAAMRPWDLYRQPLTRGKYRYRGLGFDAVIREDGRVAFRNRGTMHLQLSQVLDERMLPKNRPIVSLSLGRLDDLIAKLAGNDPYASERRSFFDKTRPLREALHERHQQQKLDAAHAELARKLTRLADEADRMGSERAQDAMFTLWDGCSEDPVGAQARAFLERFVRERCPQGEACAFDAAALARVNAKRTSTRPFAPYPPVE